MLVAKHKEPPKDLKEHLDRVAQTVASYGDDNDGECLFFELRAQPTRLIIRVIALIGMLVGWALVVFSGLLFDSNVVRGVIAFVALFCTVYQWLDEKLEKRRSAKHNAHARVALGALVQCYPGLFEEGNETPGTGAVVVTFDEERQRNPGPLIEQARALFKLRSAEPADVPANMQDLLDDLAVAERDGSDPASLPRRRFPREFAGNDETYLFHVVFYPDELPAGVLDRHLWFFAYHDQDDRVLPRALPADMWWQEEAEPLFYPEYADDEEAVG